MIMAPQINDEIKNAFILLLDRAFIPSFDQLRKIDPVDIKSAYRKKAFEFHPDRAVLLGKNQREMSESFKELNLAYEKISSFIKEHRAFFAMKGPATGVHPKPHANNFRANPERENNGERKYTYHENYSEQGKKFEDMSGLNINLPNIELLIGQFLYLCRVITWRTLIKGIVWQRNQRPLFGEIAMRWNILSEQDIKKIITEKNPSDRIGDYAFQNGYINFFEHLAIVGKQRSLQRPLGEYFINNGVSPETMEEMVIRQRRHNIKVKYGIDYAL